MPRSSKERSQVIQTKKSLQKVSTAAPTTSSLTFFGSRKDVHTKKSLDEISAPAKSSVTFVSSKKDMKKSLNKIRVKSPPTVSRKNLHSPPATSRFTPSRGRSKTRGEVLIGGKRLKDTPHRKKSLYKVSGKSSSTVSVASQTQVQVVPATAPAKLPEDVVAPAEQRRSKKRSEVIQTKKSLQKVSTAAPATSSLTFFGSRTDVHTKKSLDKVSAPAKSSVTFVSSKKDMKKSLNKVRVKSPPTVSRKDLHSPPATFRFTPSRGRSKTRGGVLIGGKRRKDTPHPKKSLYKVSGKSSSTVSVASQTQVQVVPATAPAKLPENVVAPTEAVTVQSVAVNPIFNPEIIPIKDLTPGVAMLDGQAVFVTALTSAGAEQQEPSTSMQDLQADCFLIRSKSGLSNSEVDTAIMESLSAQLEVQRREAENARWEKYFLRKSINQLLDCCAYVSAEDLRRIRKAIRYNLGMDNPKPWERIFVPENFDILLKSMSDRVRDEKNDSARIMMFRIFHDLVERYEHDKVHFHKDFGLYITVEERLFHYRHFEGPKSALLEEEYQVLMELQDIFMKSYNQMINSYRFKHTNVAGLGLEPAH